jgi:hypothetical protein
MFTLSQAKKQAAALAEMHGKPYLVFKTPANAICNQSPQNLFNTGNYCYCSADERNDYASGGVEFLA